MKKSRWQLLTVLFLIAGLVLIAGGCGDKGSSNVIKVGVILPLTGSEAMFGAMEKNSFEMAYEELKAQGKTTVNGKEIKLLFEDDQGKQDVAESTGVSRRILNGETGREISML